MSHESMQEQHSRTVILQIFPDQKQTLNHLDVYLNQC